MRRNHVPVHSQSSSLRSRVTPGVSWTTAARLCVSRLISVDLPTFGKPTIATVPGDLRRCLDLLESLELVRVDAAHAGGTASGRPSACISTRKSKSPWIFVWSTADASL